MQIVQIHSYCKVYPIMWRCVVLLNITFIRFFCILSVSLTKRLQGDRGQHTHGPRRKFDKDRQSCPSYWHWSGVVRINCYLWRVGKKNQRESESGSLLLKFWPHLMSILRFGLFLLLMHVTYFALVSKGYHHPYMKLVIDIIFQNRSYELPPLLSQLQKNEQSTTMTSLTAHINQSR